MNIVIDSIVKDKGCTKAEAAEMIKLVFAGVTAEIQETGTASISHFGSFSVSRLQRTSKLKNISYPVDVNVVKFSVFKRLKDSVNP